MSDMTYRLARRICQPAFLGCSRPFVLHAQRAAMPGGYILAANHLSPFDAPLLIHHTPRRIDFMGAVELRRNPAARRFLGLFNVFYLDRGRADTGAVLGAVRRLRQGRVVGIFPEGGVRTAASSVLSGGAIHRGVAHIADMAAAPVVPAVVLGGSQFYRVGSWMPMRGTRYGVIYGEPLRVAPEPDNSGRFEQFLRQLKGAYRELAQELIGAMGWSAIDPAQSS
ncbi:MAG: lysophospholipid acyltransferase family protein [Tepidisphaeraceae bacterium]|jgi:1-acyl-sn-glycerol-3-phosphate acyltransferase